MIVTVTTVPEHHTEPHPNARGFAALPELETSYGAKVKVWESSAATHAHLWLKIEEPDDLNQHARQGDRYDGGWHEATAHVSVETAQALAEQLMAAVEHHYHYRSDGE